MFERHILPVLQARARQMPVVTVTGPRQSGKTTLCRMAFPDKPYSNLEQPDVREFARSDPQGFLAQFPDGAVIDEVQRMASSKLSIKPGEVVVFAGLEEQRDDSADSRFFGWSVGDKSNVSSTEVLLFPRFYRGRTASGGLPFWAEERSLACRG